ncbi:MAG TPA: hypothetical protein VFX96_07080 [Pyrinomonadaceae bacterium]|nr:hypothetical protein [Pyrinomonadaceae bacterium]
MSEAPAQTLTTKETMRAITPRRSAWRLALAILTATSLAVVVASVALYTALFPPHFRGWGEVVSDRRAVAGWVVNARDDAVRVEVRLYVDGRFAGASVADLPRADVVRAGRATDERCGYDFKLPSLPPGEHEARVYAAHATPVGAYRTLVLTGTPLRFRVDEAGNVLK